MCMEQALSRSGAMQISLKCCHPALLCQQLDPFCDMDSGLGFMGAWAGGRGGMAAAGAAGRRVPGVHACALPRHAARAVHGSSAAAAVAGEAAHGGTGARSC